MKKWVVGDICEFASNIGRVKAKVIEVVAPGVIPLKIPLGNGQLLIQPRNRITYIVEVLAPSKQKWWLWDIDLYPPRS